MAIDIKKIVEETIEEIKLVDSTSPTELLQDLFITAYRFGDGAIETLDTEASLPDITDPDEQNIYFVKNAPFANPQGVVFDGGSLYFRTSTGWRPTPIELIVYQGKENGYVAGGANSSGTKQNVIQQHSLVSDTNSSVDHGDLSIVTQYHAGYSSQTNGYTHGGDTDPAATNDGYYLTKFPFASSSGGTTVANFSPTQVRHQEGNSSKVQGFGYAIEQTGSADPGLQKVSFVNENISSHGNTMFPYNSTQLNLSSAHQNSTENGYIFGGSPHSTAGNNQWKFPFASDTGMARISTSPPNNRWRAAGNSSAEKGYGHGGYYLNPLTPPGTTFSSGFYFPFASDTTVSSNVNNLTIAAQWVTGFPSETSGYVVGGRELPGVTPTFSSQMVERFPFANNTAATDLGELLTTPSGGASGHQI